MFDGTDTSDSFMMLADSMTPMWPWVLREADHYRGMEPPDVEASVYDLGTTSVRLIRVGNIVQIIFSNKHDARVVYAELASKFMRDQEKFGRGQG